MTFVDGAKPKISMLRVLKILHEEWVKVQGGKTNQGPTLHKTLMTRCLQKEASALLLEAGKQC